MSIEVYWANVEQTIIRWDYPRQFSWEDYEHARQRSHALADSVPHELCTIFEVSAVVSLPESMLANFHRLAQDVPENVIITIVVGTSGFLAMMGRVFSRVYGRVTFVNTLEEAHRQAEERLQAKAGP